jgi:hypothetical protein
MGDIDINTEVDEAINSDFELLPDDRYLAKITKTETKTTKNGKGTYLSVTFEIIEGEFRSRKVWGQFTLTNPNESAVKIGRGQLSALCKACGKLGLVEESISIWEIPLIIKVGSEQSPGYDKKNVVKSFYSASGAPKVKEAVVAGSVDDDDDIPF